MTSEAQRSTWWWFSLHALLALSLPVLFVVLAGCIRAKAKTENLGAIVNPAAINDALGRAMENTSLDTLTTGQFIYYNHTRRLENEDNVMDLGSRRVDVIDHQDVAGTARFTLKIDERERLMDNSWRDIVTEYPLWLQSTSTSTMDVTPRPAGAHLTAEALMREAATTAKTGTSEFHNLRESDATIPPPDTIRLRDNCGGLNPCSLNIHYVQFDLIIWADDVNYQKISFNFGFNLGTPYLPYGKDFQTLNGALIMDCRSTFVPIESRTVFVRDCYSMDDFKK